MQQYKKAILELILKRPQKIPALIRLKTGVFLQGRKSVFRLASICPPPISIALSVTFRCNLTCRHCWLWGDYGTLRGSGPDENNELTTDQLKSFIADVAAFKPLLHFSGGEPLLRRDICELINFASRSNLVTSLVTNATLLENKAEQIVKSGLDCLYCSLDHLPQINDRMRRGNDSSLKCLAGIKAIQDARKRSNQLLPVLQVVTTITEENHQQLFDIAQFVERELKPDIHCFTLEMFTIRGMYNSSLDIMKRNFGVSSCRWLGFIRDSQKINIQLLAEQIRKLKQHKWNFKLRLYPPLNRTDLNLDIYCNQPSKSLNKQSFCAALQLFAELLPNGDVAACAEIPENVAGNVTKQKFIDIWNSRKLNLMREYTKSNLFPVCTRCRHNFSFIHQPKS